MNQRLQEKSNSHFSTTPVFFFLVIRICMQNRRVQNIGVREGTVLECTFLLFLESVAVRCGGD